MVTNRVYKVLVTTGGAAQATVAAITAGTYAVIKKDGTVFTAGNTIAQGDEFQIVVGAPDGTRVFSDLIKVRDVNAFEKQVYRAPVEQVLTIVADVPVAGQEYSINIIDYSDKEILQTRQAKKVYTVVATDNLAATVATQFRTKINADPNAIVVASGSGANIVLTAKVTESTPNTIGEYSSQTVFDAFGEKVDIYEQYQAFGTKTYTTAPDYGSGTFPQIRKFEQRGQGYIGVTNRTKFPVEAGLYLSVAGTNYDTYIIEAERTYNSNSATFGQVKSPVTLILAVTAGQGTALEAILTPLIGSAPAEGLGVDG
jgi:hypothetical protein